MAKPAEDEVFSDQLERWIRGKGNTTLASLIDAFEDKSFAIVFVLLMLLPALPVPTGGVTYALQIIVILVALQMIFGRKTIWLPRWARQIKLGKSIKGKAIPALMKRVRWFEERSNPIGVHLFSLKTTDRISGILIIVFTVAALIAPPFTGLDTLPSIGVVVIGLAMILEDVRLLIAGSVLGVAGTALVLAVGLAILEGAQRIF